MKRSRFTLPAALALAVLVHGRPAVSQSCIDTSDYVSVVASLPLPYAHKIVLNGTLAYVTGYQRGDDIWVVDVTDPHTPAHINTINMSYAIGLALDGGFGYATDASLGLRVLDLSTPSLPVIVGGASGSYSDIVLSGSHAYVTFAVGGTTWFRVFDISTPASPQAIATLSGTPPLSRLALRNQYIYAAKQFNGGLLFIDVSNPLVPSVVGSFPAMGIVRCMSLVGNRAYFGGDTGLSIYDITEPLSPHLLGSVSTLSPVLDVVVSGDNAYALCGVGLRVVDVSDPTAPHVVEGADMTVGSGLALGNDVVYVAGGFSGLHVVDVSQPRPPTFGRLDTPGTANGVALLDGITVVADVESGLQLVDSSDPDAPALVTSFPLPGLAIAVTIAGRTAYIASAAAGLQVVDLSSPTTPSLLGSYDTPGLAYGVQVAGLHAYVADVSQGLSIVDVSDARHPVLAGSVDTPGSAFDLALSGSRVFVADGPAGLVEIDASNPSAPVVQAALPLTSNAWGLDVAGSYAYVATGFAGLNVVRIEPLPLTVVSSQEVPGFAHDVTVVGNTLYLSASEDGVHVFELSDPAHPVRVGQIFASRAAAGVAASGPLLHIADGAYGLTLAPAHCSDPTSVEPRVQNSAGTRLWAFPNPSAGATSVLFDMPRASVVRLGVFDVAGRRVRDLLQGSRAGGRHELRWDGRSDTGLLQPAGVYMLRLESTDRTVARRIVRVR